METEGPSMRWGRPRGGGRDLVEVVGPTAIWWALDHPCCPRRTHGDLVSGLYQQILLSLQKVLADPVRPLCSHYGAVVGLHALGWRVSGHWEHWWDGDAGGTLVGLGKLVGMGTLVGLQWVCGYWWDWRHLVGPGGTGITGGTGDTGRMVALVGLGTLVALGTPVGLG